METREEKKKRLLLEVSARLADIVNLINEADITTYPDITEPLDVVYNKDLIDVSLYEVLEVLDSLHSDILTELEDIDNEST